MEKITKHESKKSIGKNLQRLRKEAGFSSATSFAASVGINGNTYTQYEQGISGFSYERAWQLADALGCSMDELGGREWPPTQDILDSDERQLIDCYRRTDESDRPTLLATASTMAYAGDAKKEEHPSPASLAREDVR